MRLARFAASVTLAMAFLAAPLAEGRQAGRVDREGYLNVGTDCQASLAAFYQRQELKRVAAPHSGGSLVAAAAVPQLVSPRAPMPASSDPRSSIAPTLSDTPTMVAQIGPPRAGGPPVYSGTSGPVAWEITVVEQNRNAGGTIIQWDYEIVLRDREGRGIQFETLEVGSEGRNTVSAPRTFPFSRRLEARGEIRYQDSYRIELFVGGTANFGHVPEGREGVRLFLRFQGRADTGASVRVDIRFSLDQSVGEQPRLAADVTPLPGPRTLKADELQLLTGTWTGHLRDQRGFTFALEVHVRADGQFDAVVGTSVKRRFQGTLGISRAGDLEFTTRNVSGRATIHESGPQRISGDRLGYPAAASQQTGTWTGARSAR